MSEEKNEKTTYKLYAARTTNEVIEAVSSLRFTRITAKYTLIYCHDERIIANALPFIEYTIIRSEEANRLSPADKEWLTDCNFMIIAEEAMKKKELILQKMEDAIKVLEEELENGAPKEEKDV